jgi:hypothetical protein
VAAGTVALDGGFAQALGEFAGSGDGIERGGRSGLVGRRHTGELHDGLSCSAVLPSIPNHASGVNEDIRPSI